MDQRCCFYTNSNNEGALPTFRETPSEELDALLSTFRTNIFLPAHLIRLQKDLVYKRSNWPLLTSDEPATVRLGDEVLQLRPLDRTKDEPKTRPSFNRVLALMGKSGDWRSLPGFLVGLKSAGRKVEGEMLEKLVRKAVEAGKTGVVLECLKKVDGTGLGLWDLRVAREVMWGATAIAIQGEWSEEAVEKSIRYAENVWEMMWDPRHAKPLGNNPMSQPEIVGILVQMHAAKAVLFRDRKDEAGMVQKYTRMMLKNWDHAELGIEVGEWIDANHKMVMWAPVSHGVRMARKVVGEESSVGEILGEKLDQALGPLLRNAQLKLEEVTPKARKRRGLTLSEELSKVPL